MLGLTSSRTTNQSRTELLASLTFSRAANELNFIEGFGTYAGSRFIQPTEAARLSKVVLLPQWVTDCTILYTILSPGATATFTVVAGDNTYGVFTPSLTVPDVTIGANGPTTETLLSLVYAGTSADNLQGASNALGWERPACLCVGPNILPTSVFGRVGLLLATNNAIAWSQDQYQNGLWQSIDGATAAVTQAYAAPLGESLGIWFSVRCSTTLANLLAQQPNIQMNFKIYGHHIN